MSDHQHPESTPLVSVIEDNPRDVRLIEEGTDSSSIDPELSVIRSGQRAVDQLTSLDETAQDRYPNLVLLDLNLPGKSGFDVLSAIREESSIPDVPVVVVSSSESGDDIRRVYDSAANAYVRKPSDPDEYIQMVDVALSFWITTNASSRNT